MKGVWSVDVLAPYQPPCKASRPVTPRLVGMADNENRTETDITDLILDEHGDFRRRFVELWDLRHSGDPGAVAVVWQPLADLLEVHASAEEEIFYPVLLQRGSDEAPEETNDAIGDHIKRCRSAISSGLSLRIFSPAMRS